MKQSLADGPGPAAVFGTTLLDPSGQPDLIFGSSQPNQLTWTLTNNATGSGQDLVITPFMSGPVSPTQYHFSFNFAPGALTAAPSIPGWMIATELDSKGAIQTAYLAAASLITVSPQGNTQAVLTYTTAIQEDSNNSQVAVTITAGSNVTLAGIAIEGKTFGPIDLTLVPAGTPPLSAAPISVDFVGRRTVLNDGKTKNSFRFALTNMMSVDLVLTAKAQLDAGLSPSVFTVWFDAAPNNPETSYPWALAQVQDLDAEIVSLTPPSADWTVAKSITAASPHQVSGNPQWDLTVNTPVTLSPQAPVLFTFSGIVTDLDPGYTRMYLSFQNLGEFATGCLIGELEKSPLLYGGIRGQGFFLSGGRPTGNTPPVLNFESGLYIQQYEGRPAATLSGGRGLQIQNTEGPAAVMNGGVVINPAQQNIQGLTITSNSGAIALEVLQNGPGPALKLEGPAFLQALTTDKIVKANAGMVVSGPGTTLQVNGNLQAQSATLSGATTVSGGVLTANNGLTAYGPLSSSGPVSLMGGYQGRSFGTPYTAPTDGFVVACCYWGTSNNGFCCTRLWGYVNGLLVAMCNGGNVGTFKVNSSSDWSQVLTMNPNSITFPVPKGSTWQVNSNPDSWNQVQVTSQTLYFVPFGLTQTAAEASPQVGSGAVAANVGRTQEPDVAGSIYALVDEFARAFGTHLSNDDRSALAARVHQLVTTQTPDSPNY